MSFEIKNQQTFTTLSHINHKNKICSPFKNTYKINLNGKKEKKKKKTSIDR